MMNERLNYRFATDTQYRAQPLKLIKYFVISR